MSDARPIATAPHDGTWFSTISPNEVRCGAHFPPVVGPSHMPIETLVSEFGAQVDATQWRPITK